MEVVPRTANLEGEKGWKAFQATFKLEIKIQVAQGVETGARESSETDSDLDEHGRL